MFTTVEQVKEVTGYDVTSTIVYQAQTIIEAYIGRPEIDVTDAGDRAMVSRATAYQAAYMSKNYETVFEQMALRSLSAGDGNIILDVDLGAPFIAPLAVISLRNLSWRRSASVHTGPIMGKTALIPWERD